MSTYQDIIDKAEQEKREKARFAIRKARQVELYSQIAISLREIVKLWVPDKAKAEATANNLKGIVYCIAELHLGERPRKL